MNRRTVFRQLAIASTAAWMLPGCISDPKKVTVALNRLQITGDEEELIASIAETLIPATETPGARTVNAHHFALVMVDDCLGQAEREKYLKGLRSFNTQIQSLTGKDFSNAIADKRVEILTAFESQLDDADENTRTFYTLTRGYIIQGYTSSRHFLTEVKPYQLVPGPAYNGCAPVSADSKTPL